MDKKFFKAQALAIVMLILVIASIIGVSLFSRMSKDKDASVNEQDSAIALAEVDAILDYFVGADINALENVLGTEDTYEYTNLADVVNFLEVNDIIAEDSANLADDWCVGDDESVKVGLSLAGPDDYVEVQPGSVLSLNLDGISFVEGKDSTLRVNLKSVDEYSAFLIKKIVDDPVDGVSESKENYCITKAGSICETDIDNANLGNIDTNTWSTSIVHVDGNQYYKEFDLKTESNNNIEELRILPISGVLAFNNVQPEGVENKNFLPIKVSAEATCRVTRGEEMYLPGSGLLGYSTLFDYGIYDSGYLQP